MAALALLVKVGHPELRPGNKRPALVWMDVIVWRELPSHSGWKGVALKRISLLGGQSCDNLRGVKACAESLQGRHGNWATDLYVL